jgi:hypothetical protein
MGAVEVHDNSVCETVYLVYTVHEAVVTSVVRVCEVGSWFGRGMV